MIRQGEAAFVDGGARIALALSRDPLHEAAREQWELRSCVRDVCAGQRGAG